MDQGGSTQDGQPLPVGAVVRAYTLPACWLAGWYPVSVYGDNPMTPHVDEGAVAGDPIAFTVDGYPAVSLGPDAPVWTESGSRLHGELRACILAGDFDCDRRATVANLMRQAQSFGVVRGKAGYYPPFDRDSDGDIGSQPVTSDATGDRHGQL